MTPLIPGTDPLCLTVDGLMALLEGQHFRARVYLALPAPKPLQLGLIGATTSGLLGITGPDEPGTVWLLGGLEASPMPADAWNPRHRLRP